jgi:hypothetical protein
LALNNPIIQLADSIAATDRKSYSEASDDTSDEDLHLGAPKFFSSSSLGKKVILPPKLSIMSHGKHRAVKQVLPNLTAPQKLGSKQHLKRSRAVMDSDSDHDPDSQVGNKRKQRKKSARDMLFEYDSEEDIAERNNSLKTFFL